ncbi:MAG: hypothetical protein H6706_00390 [Myxococcales bacterium]|nr:hypothetical protein [Myxococcales bacterium]
MQPSRSVMTLVERAVRDFELIAPGDRVAVAISGGKDSLLLAQALRALSRRSDCPFEVAFIHLDQRQPGFAYAQLTGLMARLELPLQIIEADTWSVVEASLKPGQIPCALCGRMRRGILNRWCAEHGYNKLALGHHLDDALETFLLNLLFQRRLDPLKPATPTEDGGVVAIRPLILVEERKIVAWAEESGLEPVACPVCDSFPASRRRDLKGVIETLRAVSPDLHASVRAALYGGEPAALSVIEG